MPQPDHLTHLRADTSALAATIDAETVDAPVRACPGWDLRQLAGHLGWVHRWAATSVRTGAPPDPATIPEAPEAPEPLAQWVLDGGMALAEELGRRDPDEPTWHPFAAPLVIGVWRRRQAQETSLHRWDAQDAVGEPEPIDAWMAADGVGEYFEVMLPRRFARDGGSPPPVRGWLQVRAEDVDRSWWVRSVEGRVEVAEDPAGTADAVLVGRAEELLLVLWARADPTRVQIHGDASLAATWLALEGN